MRRIRKLLAAALSASMALTFVPGTGISAKAAESYESDQVISFETGVPWNVSELESVVDYNDPASVAACVVAACVRYTDNANDGDAMLKKLCATKEPFGLNKTIGGYSSSTASMLKEPDRKWIPRSYFDGGTAANGRRISPGPSGSPITSPRRPTTRTTPR